MRGNASASKASDSMGIGERVAQRLTAALSGHGIPYDVLSRLVYSELQAMSDDHRLGDWIEMPNGNTYQLVYKVTKP